MSTRSKNYLPPLEPAARSVSARYALPAIWLHWLSAGLIAAALPLGVYMHELPLSPYKLRLFSYHKWIGVTALLAFVVRLVVRIRHTPPAALPAPAWQQRMAHVTHGLLYFLLLAVPLSGWLMSSAKGFSVVYLGILPLPDLVGKNRELGVELEHLHKALNIGLLSLLALHVAAALKHHILDRDATLSRMSPFGK
ncbi:cytochrome b [Extensimonas sp. H3M7-6]|jgi:cytochrome b561|uniref:cytochrome b n=1 Tax=Extensimonas soli TaxID=3031322 RepID=UPI0023D98444|nr:cytochrome b/b6 domain-containing protein [Extensimonas sp. H3M7-6]MDF1482196.1 cytochrome b/b6 domain-containing protein [Extensimonas sp. H3M7-6]